jgi:REP element-mobilizing transposase RayT
MTGPLAYHLIWTTYGTWLPGDGRGWTDADGAAREPDEALQEWSRAAMTDGPASLTPAQREVVAATVTRHCDIRGWHLHALHVGGVHVHVVVTAGKPPDTALSEFKAWCSRTLNERFGRREWWTEGGCKRRVESQRYFDWVVRYVSECQ